MKNRVCILVAALLAILLACPALAANGEGEYADMMELYEMWSWGDMGLGGSGCPDWVASVFSRDGYAEHITVLLVEGEEAREAELRAMLRDDTDLVVLTGGKYSHNELRRVQDELGQELADGVWPGITGCGVGWTSDENGVHGFGESGFEDRVTVSVLSEHYEEVSAALIERYGDMVVAEPVDGYAVTTAGSEEAEPAAAEAAEGRAVAEAGSPGDAPQQLFADMRELNNYWAANGYPDWVGGTYSPSAREKYFGVLIVAGEEDKEAELRAMLLDDSTLEVTTGCPCSYNRLLAIQQELYNGKKTDPPGITSSGIGWTSDENGIHGFGPSGRELRITVIIRPKYYESSRAILLERYGENIFDFQMGKEPFRNYIAIGAAALGVVTAAILIVGKKRK